MRPNHIPPDLEPRPSILLAFIAVSIVLVLASCSTATQVHTTVNLLTPAPVPASAVENLFPAKLPDGTNGAIIYSAKCQPCHGDDGMGNGPRAEQIRAQGGQVARLDDPAILRDAKPNTWFDVLTNGRIDKLMPGFNRSLSDQDRWDVLAYVWAMGTNTETVQSGRALYVADCAACHGSIGKGDGPKASGLKLTNFGDPAFMSGTSLADLATSMTAGDAHKPIHLDDAQKAAVADYVRTFAYNYVDVRTVRSSALLGDGMFRLEATNLTPHGGALTNTPVTLHAYDTTGEVFSRTAQIVSGGVLTFSQLPTQQAYFYQAQALYGGARFYAAPQQFSGTLMLTASLPIYEVTTNPSTISISEYHYFVQQAGEGSLTIVEFYVFDNSGDHAYVDKPGPANQPRTVRVSLPADATNLRFDGPGLGARFFQDGSTVYDSDPVPPGQGASTITMIYDIPYHGSKQMDRQLNYAVRAWDVILPDNELRVSGLTDKGLQALQTGSIRLYSPDQPTLSPGGTASFVVTGHPRAVSVPGDDSRAVGFGLVAIALTAAAGYFLIARARREWVAERPEADQRQILLHQIVALDSKFASGQLPEIDYRKLRAALKQQLRAIWS